MRTINTNIYMGSSTPPGKSQVAIGFLRNSGTDHFEKQLDPSRCALLQRNLLSFELLADGRTLNGRTENRKINGHFLLGASLTKMKILARIFKLSGLIRDLTQEYFFGGLRTSSQSGQRLY